MQKQVGIKKPDYVLEKFYEVFNDRLFSSWNITLEYDMTLDAIIIYSDGKKAGYIEPNTYPILDRRVEFTGGSVWFNTSWFCNDILPKQIIFTELKK